ncbi:GvpL/GvpF family gas vesicle protein [Actinopolymorpha alba]|uniref:GvpL/GvpF family gas vesicle protein n=1 Tax=Actinopolymorpha alba TaxID=533267 RepID=UPI0003628411|nr:GvpL/GvpF family gas vesicle protein [Actinopolymorpha alba]
MSVEQPNEPVYVYGVVAANRAYEVEGVVGVGEPARPARLLEADRVTAVVSDTPPGLRAKRRDLLAHQHVLDELGRQGTVVPMRFGVVARDETSLRDELVRDNEAYLALLAEVENRLEYNVKAFADEDELISEVAETDPTVRELRQRSSASATVEDQVRLGEAVAAALETRQEALAEPVLETLRPFAVRSVIGPQVQDCAVNVSFLVNRGDASEFLSVAEKLGERLQPRVRLRLTGPLPPYSFVQSPQG